MIFGIGTDLVEIARIERTYQRYGSHFVERLLTDREQALFHKTRRKVRFLAMHFAAKEAIVKAIGTGFSSGIWIRDIGTYPDPLGKPCIEMTPRARGVCHRRGASSDGFISLSDEKGLAQAFAILLSRR